MTATAPSLRFTVDPNTGCWNWDGARSRDGYGQLWFGGKVVYAHRVAYALFVGFADEKQTLDHLCRNPRCCNPQHLEAVSPAENVRRGKSAKLTAEAVAEIRRPPRRARVAHFAEKYGVSVKTIHAIRTGRGWS